MLLTGNSGTSLTIKRRALSRYGPIIVALLGTVLFTTCSAPRTHKSITNAAPPAGTTPRYESTPTRTFNARVVSIADGDTIVVQTDDQRSYEVRLQGIDAPEGGQPFGNKSRENLSDLIAGTEVTIEWTKRDRYRRIVGVVSINGRDICLEQIKAGMAWHYKYYQSDQTPESRALFADAEVEARTSKRGLWTDSDPIPPWDFGTEDELK